MSGSGGSGPVESGPGVIEIFAPDGVGEVAEGTDLVALVAKAVAGDVRGPLRDQDIVVVTSKILSKAEGRTQAAAHRLDVIDNETVATVARRGPMRIVRTPLGLTIAAAGVDNSNVDPTTVLLLPLDPDASARALRSGLEALTGVRLGVIVSDTAGRAWRIGQTDHAIGAAGVRVVERYDGRTDPYGNELHVTAVAIADELAAAADLVKSKLGGRPVAVVRGLGHHLASQDVDTSARDLVRAVSEDLFARGARESVVEALLRAFGKGAAYEDVIATPEDQLADEVVAALDAGGAQETFVRSVVAAALEGPAQ